MGLEASWKALLDAGINDWGGMSPLTRDYVNPEKPWPHVESLAAATAATGKVLLPRCVVRWLIFAAGQVLTFAALALSPSGALFATAACSPEVTL